jgi:hypothetical protein
MAAGRHQIHPNLQRRQMMPVETITVLRSGIFASEPAPDWLRRLNALADENNDWDAAAHEVLGDSDLVAEVQDHLSVAVQVHEWRTPENGRYVEFSDVLRIVAEVWIPDPADWIPFYTSHIAPFLRAHAEMATAGQLDRIGNCLIAFARHGEGQHVNRDCGRSQIDLNHDRDLIRRANRASARSCGTASRLSD